MIRTIGDDSRLAVQYVAVNMRQRDKDEIFATSWTDSPFDLAENVIGLGGVKYLACAGDEPVACFGAAPNHPGVVNVWLFGTPSFPRVLPDVTRFIIRAMVPLLVDQGVHRAHCLSLATYPEIHKWLRLLGAREEGVKARYGKNQEDFVEFVWSVESCVSRRPLPRKTIPQN